jgi:Flp pilus assembly secretin CpaC
VVTLKLDESAMVISEMTKSESRSVSGTPGLSEIPGMDNLTGKDADKNYSTLLVVMTPHVVRGIQLAGRSPMMRIERGQKAH